MKAPNEKLIELLFTRHSLQYCGSETVLYAPSTREEYRNGYDAKFTGKEGCVELCLQFKTPSLTKDGFTVSIREHQHQTLLSYPRNSAFYVTHAFRTIAEIQQCQLEAIQAKDFLKYYIAIEAHSLCPRANFVQYVRDSSSYPQFPKF